MISHDIPPIQAAVFTARPFKYVKLHIFRDKLLRKIDHFFHFWATTSISHILRIYFGLTADVPMGCLVAYRWRPQMRQWITWGPRGFWHLWRLSGTYYCQFISLSKIFTVPNFSQTLEIWCFISCHYWTTLWYEHKLMTYCCCILQASTTFSLLLSFLLLMSVGLHIRLSSSIHLIIVEGCL